MAPHKQRGEQCLAARQRQGWQHTEQHFAKYRTRLGNAWIQGGTQRDNMTQGSGSNSGRRSPRPLHTHGGFHTTSSMDVKPALRAPHRWRHQLLAVAAARCRPRAHPACLRPAAAVASCRAVRPRLGTRLQRPLQAQLMCHRRQRHGVAGSPLMVAAAALDAGSGACARSGTTASACGTPAAQRARRGVQA